jgi:2,3-bisphosphoglycerate-independent phosphoglycerate mutase
MKLQKEPIKDFLCLISPKFPFYGCASVLTVATQDLVRSVLRKGGSDLRAVLVIADGMADRPIRELGWKTPLEAAHRPGLNRIAENGVSGILDPIAPGIPPGSDTSTLALLGYDSLRVYSGRGALEAVGSGVEVLPGDVAFRCNLATVDKNLVVLDRRAGRIDNEDAVKLAESLQNVKLKKSLNVEFFFKSTVQHRAALVIRGHSLSTCISDSDPEAAGKPVLEVKPLDNLPDAKRTARIVNELMQEFHKILKEHPVNKERAKRKLPVANMVLCRGAGTVPKIPPISDVFGIKAACIAAVPLIRGVCKVAGMRLVNVKGATGTVKTDYMAKARAAVEALKVNDFVLLHVKATDVASHDGKFKLKTEIVQKIDGMLEYVLDHVSLDSTYLAVTADHTTSCVTGNHEGDPVPVAITGPYVRCDGVVEFGERSCAKGGLNRIRGVDLMPTLMGLLGKTVKFGA